MKWPIVGLVVALLVGGSWLAAEAQTPSGLTVQVSTEPPGLDLTATPASATAAVVFYNVQECLVKIDRHGKIVPWLAERWRVTDQKNYTFFLKPGVRFHNGRELKAADVKFVIERAMNPETKHPYPQYYAPIGDITVKDDYTITFALKSPNANFLINLARQGSVIYPSEAVDTLKSAPIGTGPFKMGEWVRGDRIELVKNPDYHVKGLPKLDRVTFRFIADPNAAMAALKAGDVPPATRLLAEAGYPNGFETTLKGTPMYNPTVRAGEITAGQLAKAGIQARLEQIEWTQWLSRVWRQSVYDMTIIGHAEAWDIGNYANPRYYFRYDNPKFQETFKQSEVAVSDTARRELYVQMQKQLVEDAPVVFLFMHPRLAVAKKGVQGLWKDLPIPSADLSEVSWAPAK